MRILHYPCIRTQDELDALYHRACWYLPGMDDHVVVFPSHAGPLAPGRPPQAFGVEGRPRFRAEFPVVRDNPEAVRLLQQADFLLLWRDDCNRMERYNLEGLARRRLDVCAGSLESRNEAYHNAILCHEFLTPGERQALVAENKARFATLVPKLRAPRAYVFGTGPSLAMAMDRDFSDGVSIVCNTAVRNEALLERIRPACIVAADPALHFGVSRYAAAFREHLARAMRRYGAYLFLPMGYYPLFVRHYPEFASRVFGVPVAPARPENVSVDLVARYGIACYANILTLLLLPLGATLAPEVRVLGCDGRDPSPAAPDGNPSPFWKHHGASEFEAVYHTLAACHPAFFRLDFGDWYAGHCEGVRIVTEAAEAAGRVVRVDTPSFIPSLAQRLAPPFRAACLAALEKAPAVAGSYVLQRDTRRKSRYTVSVLVSLYKAARFVAPLLRNLLSQTLYRRDEVEILLIDSASPENEAGEAAPFLTAHPHLFYGRTAARETVYGALNRALAAARGRYVMALGADNRLRLDALELLAGCLDGRPDIGLVYGNHFVTCFENESFYNHVRFGRCCRPRFSRDMLLHKFYFGSEMLWRRELHDKVGPYDDSYVVAGDYDMVCRLATVTDFLHLDRYFGLYLKSPGGVEQSNLALCRAEDRRIRETYADVFPEAVDPPRVHVHYPVDPRAPQDYMAIVCRTSSFDGPIDPWVLKIAENLEYPFILYGIDQNSSQATLDSIAHLAGEGLLVSGEALLPRARALFEDRIAYAPTLRFFLLAHGATVLLEKDFLAMRRPELTAYFRQAHQELTAAFRTPQGRIDPLAAPGYGDWHEFKRLDLAPHAAVDDRGVAPGVADGDMTVCIQHYAPPGQEGVYREALVRAIAAVRRQDYPGTVRVVVTDDGSAWSAQLAGDDPRRRIRAHDRASLAGRAAFGDIDADLYLYKPRTGYFSKGVLWDAAWRLTTSGMLVFLDDDHCFARRDALAQYAALLDRYAFVVGRIRDYAFKDIDGVRHTLRLGYDSPVVQGTNYGLRRETLAAVGGFDRRTFLWGTGDDPALFWKLFLLLRPQSDDAPRRACYAEGIVTDNLHSGRWRENCRVDLELFLRDFLRRYGVHPNANPSRDRRTWMDRAPDPRAEPARAAPAQRDAGPDAAVLTVVVAATDAPFEDVWTTVAALLGQRLPEPHRIVVAAGPDFDPADAALLPRSVGIRRLETRNAAEALRACLAEAEAPFACWIMAGDLPGEKLLKGALTHLRETGADAVYGASARASRDGFALAYAAPPPPSASAALALAGLWQPGQPVCGKTAVLRELAVAAPASPVWDLEGLMRAAAGGVAIAAREQVFSLHGPDAPAPLSEARAAALVSACYADRLAEALSGGIAALRGADGAQCRPESQRLVPWARQLRAGLDWLRRTIQGAARGKAGRAAVFGADRDGELLATLYWPRGLEAVCFIDERAAGTMLAGLPVLAPGAFAPEGFAAVLPASPQQEERFLQAARAQAWPERFFPAPPKGKPRA